MYFINKYSATCLLGPMSKNFKIDNDIASWSVNKKNHFVALSPINNISYLKTLNSTSFHYLSQYDIDFLKQHFPKLEKRKGKSILLDLTSFNLVGKPFRAIRNAINKCKNKQFTIQDSFNKIEDVKEFINTWSETSGNKYFRDFSGKTLFFFKNNFHKDCVNIFIYDNDKLISFGSASPPTNNHCSYIVGKALCLQYPGLSEFTDFKLYEKLLNIENNLTINMGRATKGLLFFKQKFPNSQEIIHYDGKIQI